MAATEAGVWGLQDVRDKQLQSEWDYTGGRPLYTSGYNTYGNLGQNDGPTPQYSSPTQVGTQLTWNRVTSLNSVAMATKTDNTLCVWGYG